MLSIQKGHRCLHSLDLLQEAYLKTTSSEPLGTNCQLYVFLVFNHPSKMLDTTQELEKILISVHLFSRQTYNQLYCSNSGSHRCPFAMFQGHL